MPGLERWLDQDQVRNVAGFTLPIIEERDAKTVLQFCTYTIEWSPTGGTLFRWTATLDGDAITWKVRTIADGLRSPFYGG